MKPLRVLMASEVEDIAGMMFHAVIEGGGHHLTIINPWQREKEFLEEARCGVYDVVILTNIGFSLGYVNWLIASVCQAGSAKVIVMSGFVGDDARRMALQEGAVAFYHLPSSAKQILEAVEAAAGR